MKDTVAYFEQHQTAASALQDDSRGNCRKKKALPYKGPRFPSLPAYSAAPENSPLRLSITLVQTTSKMVQGSSELQVGTGTTRNQTKS